MKISLWDMPMIRLQSWIFSKITQNREVSTFFSVVEFWPKPYTTQLPAKAPPSSVFCGRTTRRSQPHIAFQRLLMFGHLVAFWLKGAVT